MRASSQEKTKKSRKGGNNGSASSKKKPPQASALVESDMVLEGDAEEDADALMNLLQKVNDGVEHADVQLGLAPIGQLPMEGGEHSSSGSSVSADDIESAQLFEAPVSLPPGVASGIVEHVHNEFEHTIEAFIDGALFGVLVRSSLMIITVTA